VWIEIRIKKGTVTNEWSSFRDLWLWVFLTGGGEGTICYIVGVPCVLSRARKMDSAVGRNTEDDSEKQRESGKTMFKAVPFDTNRLFG
jgi:hypothetical protein